MRVFVLCPDGCAGVEREALQQLVARGRALGFDVRLSRVWEAAAAADAVEDLHAPVDAPDSVIVALDVELVRLLEFKLARRVIWWSNIERFTRINEGLRHALGLPQAPMDFAFESRFPALHWARSEHVRAYLQRRGVQAELVTAFIEPETLAQAKQLSAGQKLNAVLYDDQAGGELVRQVMQRVPRATRWIGLSSISASETAPLLVSAKAYLDFGAHSEFPPLLCTAVAAGCVAVVGTRGVAGQALDLPLPETYKFDERDPNAAASIASLLCQVLENGALHSAQLAPFRAWLEAGESVFVEQLFARLGALEAQERRSQRLAV